jgi:hypothetical protein
MTITKESVAKGRKAAQALVLNVMRDLEPGGKNAEMLEKLFSSMDDKKFLAWAKEFASDPKAYFQLQVIPYIDEPKMPEIKKAASRLNLPLEETIELRHLGIKTRTKVPVGYLFLKRHQQVISKKNQIVMGIGRRNQRTGQVIGDSKAARVSDMENFGLQTMNARSTLRELMGPRADDMRNKMRMYEDLSLHGVTSQADLASEPRDKTVLRTIDMMFLGAMIRTDLVSETMILPIAVERMGKKEKLNT